MKKILVFCLLLSAGCSDIEDTRSTQENKDRTQSARTSCDKPEACNLIPDAGTCKAKLTKYYYDKAEGKCKEFIWGGCDGTVPFETMQACKACECTNDQ